MLRGTLSHRDFTITDPTRSVPFYQTVLSWLGYSRVPVGPRRRRARVGRSPIRQEVSSPSGSNPRADRGHSSPMIGMLQGATMSRFMLIAAPMWTSSMRNS
jgi:hypothetical protein